MSTVADRHTGRLGNRLADFTSHQPVTVLVAVVDDVAGRTEAQHLTWMLLNLLARAEGVVTGVALSCSDSAVLASGVIPELTGADKPTAGEPFRDAAIRAANAIGVVPVVAARAGDSAAGATGYGRRITVTDAPTDADDLAVYGRGWRAGLHHGQRPGLAVVTGTGSPPTSAAVESGSRDRPKHDPLAAIGLWATMLDSTESQLPFGPYFAACLAAGEVYLAVRMPAGQYAPARSYGWDCWTARPLTVGSTTLMDGHAIAQPEPGVLSLDLSGSALAGVGAVGAAWMHTLWACRGLHGDVPIVDADSEGVTVDNLNRGVLFTRADIGRPKAATAASATPNTIKWKPALERFEDSGHAPDVLISAVDGNVAREALQGRYRPVTLSASTRDLRAESLRISPEGSAACLRCHNAPKPTVSDEEVRAAALADEGAHLLHEAAEATLLDAAELASKLQRRDCDAMSERALIRLRELTGLDLPEFSVGFVSVAAGVLLATETVKVYLGANVNGSVDGGGFANRAPTAVAFQFWRPHAATNGLCHLGRDPDCPACRPDSPALAVWKARWQQWRRRGHDAATL